MSARGRYGGDRWAINSLEPDRAARAMNRALRISAGSPRDSAAQCRWRAHGPEFLVLFKSGNERVTRAGSSPSGGSWSASQDATDPA